MTVKSLFELSQYITSKGLKASYVEVKEETSFGMAFGLSWSNVTNNQTVKGQFIVLESVSAEESVELHLLLATLMSVSDFLHKTWFDYYENGKYRVIITVS